MFPFSELFLLELSTSTESRKESQLEGVLSRLEERGHIDSARARSITESRNRAKSLLPVWKEHVIGFEDLRIVDYEELVS